MVEAEKQVDTIEKNAATEAASAATQEVKPSSKTVAGVSPEIEAQMAAYYAKQLVHPRTLFSYDKDNVIQEGDTVVIYEKQD